MQKFILKIVAFLLCTVTSVALSDNYLDLSIENHSSLAKEKLKITQLTGHGASYKHIRTVSPGDKRIVAAVYSGHVDGTFQVIDMANHNNLCKIRYKLDAMSKKKFNQSKLDTCEGLHCSLHFHEGDFKDSLTVNCFVTN